MPPSQDSLASAFCELVGAPDLLTWLDLPLDVPGEAAQAALKVRRRKMQGMQANPKYKDQARFLIKNFAALEAELADPAAHLARRREAREAAVLPALEMTIETVLQGAQVTEQQIRFLQGKARELGVSDESFRALVEARIEHIRSNTPLPPGSSQGPQRGGRSSGALDQSALATGARPPSRRPSAVDTVARDPDRGAAGEPRVDELATLPPSDVPTAPPATLRAGTDNALERAKARNPDLVTPLIGGTPILVPSRSGLLRVVGETTRTVEVGSTPVEVTFDVETTSPRPVHATVASNVHWLEPRPRSLPPGARRTTITVRVLPSEMDERRDYGTITLHLEGGDRVEVTYFVEQQHDSRLVAGLAGGAALLATLALGFFIVRAVMAVGAPGESLTVVADPAADAIVVDGTPLGQGSVGVLANPSPGTHTIEVRQLGYRPWSGEVEVVPGGRYLVHAALTPERDLDWRPPDDSSPGRLPDDAAGQLPMEALARCARAGYPTGLPTRATLEVYASADGTKRGIAVDDGGLLGEPVKRCLVRTAATASLPPVEGGDHAVLTAEVDIR